MFQEKWEDQLVDLLDKKEDERKEKLKKLSNIYNDKLKNYSKLVDEFYDNQNKDQRKRDYAFNTLQPKIKQNNEELNRLLVKIRTVINESNSNIEKNRKIIRKNRKEMSMQDTTILDYEREIDELKRRVTSGSQRLIIANEKGYFTRNLIAFFIVIIVLIVYILRVYYT